MKKSLADLNAQFFGAGGEGIFDANGNPVPERRGVGVILNCPCGCINKLYVPFKNPLDGGAPLSPRGWERVGETIETLTLSPSILRVGEDSCKWHGWIKDGSTTDCQ